MARQRPRAGKSARSSVETADRPSDSDGEEETLAAYELLVSQLASSQRKRRKLVEGQAEASSATEVAAPDVHPASEADAVTVEPDSPDAVPLLPGTSSARHLNRWLLLCQIPEYRNCTLSCSFQESTI